jgi:predicted DNA-binding protein (MmcQ/YjbR family)
MNRDAFDAVCAGLPGAHHVVQWGDASVWKVGPKVFAVGGWSEPPDFAVTFKASPASFAMLKDAPGLRPAPYLASRGLAWLQRTDARTLTDAELAAYLRQSWRLVASGLTRKARRELGLQGPLDALNGAIVPPAVATDPAKL